MAKKHWLFNDDLKQLTKKQYNKRLTFEILLGLLVILIGFYAALIFAYSIVGSFIVIKTFLFLGWLIYGRLTEISLCLNRDR